MSTSFTKRIRNKICSFFNRIKFRIYKVKFGSGLCVHGHIGIDISKYSTVSIGRNCYISNGDHMNPLSRNVQSSIRTEDGAELYIGNNVGMSSVVIWCHHKISIGNNTNIGANSIILDSDCHSLNHIERHNLQSDMEHKKSCPVLIGDDVLIGANCIILKGVNVGSRSIVGAGSVVTRDVPEDTIVAGNPAVIIKSLK